ncbi:MAG: HypC/HybG/HupF family hydrogenase formation chaperone [Verrucomicrobia bacterium]|nr:HypC/HybG/HupF family hydrogenase formation chaperone [Verrucomicrobiota bacterium]
MCLAVPAKVVELLPEGRAKIELGGILKEISVELIEDVRVNDYVIVHVGYALTRVDPEEAAKTLDVFRELTAADASGSP